MTFEQFMSKFKESIEKDRYVELLEVFSQMEGIVLAVKNQGTKREKELIEVIQLLIVSNKELLKKILKENQ